MTPWSVRGLRDGLARFAVVGLVLIAACAANERDLRIGATATVSAFIACDVGQTIYESDGGRWDRRPPDLMPPPGQIWVEQESNPVLGRTPSIPLLVGAGVGSIAAVAFAGVKLPAWAAYPMLAVVGGVESYLVGEHIAWGGVCGVGGGSIGAP